MESEIARAKAGESVLLFMDGVHFVQVAFLGYLWCFTRIFFRSLSGRKRWNVLGTYNAISGQLTVVANDGYITATTVCEMLRKLSVQYAGRPIVIVLDNARFINMANSWRAWRRIWESRYNFFRVIPRI
ncbi:MAG: hypothetical protein LBQ54_02910 [Planctomycetaceae bacterium]|nr:hypothetical protein [Planctomycetaceae bacterium]